MRQYRRTTIVELIKEYRTDSRYDTGAYDEADLNARDCFDSEGILSLYTLGSGRQFPGIIGYFDCRKMFGELASTSWTNDLISDNHRTHYHAPGPAFTDPVQDIKEWFSVRSHSAAFRRMPRTS